MRKQIIGLIALCAAAFAARGAESDWFGVFCTSGPDCYSDGSLVLPNEEYALVWQKSGTSFQGFRDDGTLVDGENSVLLNKSTWLAKPLDSTNPAQGCHLDYITVTVPLQYAQTGSFSVYVLDTRRYSGHVYDGAGNLVSVNTNVTSVLAAGSGKAINGYAEVAAYATMSGGMGGLIEGTTADKTYFLSTLDNTKIPAPVITGMRLEGEYVVLTVSSTSSQVTYDAVSSTSISTTGRGASAQKAVAPVSGAAEPDGQIEIRLRRDVEAKSQFFRVIRRQY